MEQEELEHKQELLSALKRRLHKREVQLAKLGVTVDPCIETEIEDIRAEIERLGVDGNPKPFEIEKIEAEIERIKAKLRQLEVNPEPFRKKIFYFLLGSILTALVLVAMFAIWQDKFPAQQICRVRSEIVFVHEVRDIDSLPIAELPMGTEFTPEFKTTDGLWLRIPPILGFPRGWVTASSNFVACTNLDAVPVDVL
jgi:hypothetical protein